MISSEILHEVTLPITINSNDITLRNIIDDSILLLIQINNKIDNKEFLLEIPYPISYKISYKEIGSGINFERMLYLVENSEYKEWAINDGMHIAYSKEFNIKHYQLHVSNIVVDILTEDICFLRLGPQQLALNGLTLTKL